MTWRLPLLRTAAALSSAVLLSVHAGPAIGQTTRLPAPSATLDVFDLNLPDGWRVLAQAPGERTWGLLDANRRGSFLTLYRTGQPLEHEWSTRLGRVTPLPATVLGDMPATSHQWRGTEGTSLPLQFLVRCTTQPLADGAFACAIAGVAGEDFEARKPELTRILDTVRFAVTKPATPSSPTGSGTEIGVAMPGSSPGDSTVPPPIRRVIKIADNWNTENCGLTDTARFILGTATQITRLELWFHWSEGESAVAYEISDASRLIVRGQLTRGQCDRQQAGWCDATASLTTETAPGSYTLRVAHGRLCQNARSGNTGFLRLRGMQ
ncbi:MAG: hypothetical protein ACKVP7_14530 [Hyphomicrobiaceae bacterium]